ncbi:uncharacterized protein SCHCODRAFT_01091971 [Schizophyllum commune H4-8]|uniref:Uncharacterized protein n=1 Tax=Schizophyllum commune (strain H4-8 / FGSC 9210) TaxID=578458 RepID=D8PYK7_SCHCM|nr:uncharacterized protein SCHCODRAFT_01091971 [Schizophyllum commune H4-8]KAI5896007.1 hypothetical protein SCHCODRAFT_01091971 [Schizophyllum commune H4-8]
MPHAHLSRFEDSYPSVRYTAVEEKVSKLFERGSMALQRTDEDWELVETCCYAACPAFHDHLYAPADVERACTALATVNERTGTKFFNRSPVQCSPPSAGSSTAREVVLLVATVRARLEEHYPNLREGLADPDAPFCFTLNLCSATSDTAHLLSPMGMEEHELKKLVRTTVVVDVLFYHNDAPRYRRIQVMPEGWAGHIRAIHRPLTQAAFATTLAKTPPALLDLTKRERLFSRKCEAVKLVPLLWK